jgi:hypothetical protein
MRKKAVFTIAQDEKFFLPLWLAYYSKHFPEEDIFVLDHDSIERPNVGNANLMPVHREETHSYAWLTHVAYQFQRFLLTSYEWVLFCDIDEIIVSPKVGLGKFIDSLGKEHDLVRCLGYEIIQQRHEPFIDWAKPLLRQRETCYGSILYSKTLLSRRSLPWAVGFHEIMGHSPAYPNSELLLLHLHKIDFQMALQRNRDRLNNHPQMSDYDAGFRLGWQNFLTDEKEFEAWFYNDVESTTTPLENIPEEWKDLV